MQRRPTPSALCCGSVRVTVSFFSFLMLLFICIFSFISFSSVSHSFSLTQFLSLSLFLHHLSSLSTCTSFSFLSVVSPISDCDSCLTLVVLSRLQLGSNATQPKVTSFLRSVCQSHPGVLPKVKNLIFALLTDCLRPLTSSPKIHLLINF